MNIPMLRRQPLYVLAPVALLFGASVVAAQGQSKIGPVFTNGTAQVVPAFQDSRNMGFIQSVASVESGQLFSTLPGGAIPLCMRRQVLSL